MEDSTYKEFDKQVQELSNKMQEEEQNAIATQEDVNELLDSISKSIEELREELEQTLTITDAIIDGLRRMFHVTKVGILKDYRYIKKIQKSGFGKVEWNRFDIVKYRLTGAREYLVHAYGKPVGFLHIRDIQEEDEQTWHIMNLVFLEEYQNKGLGRETLEYVKELATKDNIQRLTLNVRETNEKAITTYLKSGFVEVGRMKGYYRDTNEDAIHMDYHITQE